MQITKYGHACVVLEKDGRRIVLDPGGLTPQDATEGAAAILITHEHFDHFSAEKVLAACDRDPELRVVTCGPVAEQLSGLGPRLTVAGDGDVVGAAGFDIQVHGEWHALLHPDIPRVASIGFLIDESVFHPGDALTVPASGVATLLLPVHGPWSRTGELIDYVRAVAPGRALAIHDGALNAVGLAMVGGLLGDQGPGTGAPYQRLAPGESLDIG